MATSRQRPGGRHEIELSIYPVGTVDSTRPARSCPVRVAVPGPARYPGPDFALPSVAGGEVKLADLSDPVLLVAFLSNHCPFVRHIESALAGLVVEYTGHGLAAVGVASNDV